MKISIFASVLLLSAAVLSVEKVKHDVKWFTNQHIIEEMNEDDCTNVINGRGIMKDDGSCKWSNTFIKAPLKAVTNVCETPALKGNLHRSTTPFDLIYCEQTKENAAKTAKPPHCEYEKGRLHDDKKIIIGCEDGIPVHYERIVTLVTVRKMN
uniref:Ribonuclease A-domain domain-containing protein n=1 Tax=Sander lucioperca TaxID=283035 RepID=A0A8C9XBZ3_SANLU